MPLCFLGVIILASLASGQGLKGGHLKCSSEQEGRFVQVPGIRNARCKCLSGILQSCQASVPACQKELLGCHFVEDSTVGNCPTVCKGCIVDGSNNGTDSKLRLASGQVIVEEGICMAKKCFSGVLTVSPVRCPTPECLNPVQKPGECCPTCKENLSYCVRGGQKFEVGETKPDILDPCNQCTCTRQGMVCERTACPVLPCEDRLAKRQPGKCCPECTRRHQASSGLVGKCLFKAQSYAPGERFKPDVCTNCTCNKDLTVVCERETCPVLTCPLAAQVRDDPKECCSTCNGSYQEGQERSLTSAAATRPTHCTHSGSMYRSGEKWRGHGCLNCSCVDGETKCVLPKCPPLSCSPGLAVAAAPSQDECCPRCRPQPRARQIGGGDAKSEGVCTVFGDPHYRTFDGRIFNFQGSCKYLLSSDCSGSGNSTFSIRITNDARDSMAFSWLRTITVRLAGLKISLLQKMKVKVDGKRVKLPYIKLGALSVMKEGYKVHLRTNLGLELLWDGVSFLEVSMPAKFRGRLCGLCGNFDGNAANDFYGRGGRGENTGSLLDDGQAFGNTWRVGGLRACSVLPRDMPHSYTPQCTQTWQEKIESDRHCNALNSTLFHRCASAGVDTSYFYNACKLDMCECPGDQCHCEVLTAYARECERRAGIIVHNWREATGCLNVSSFKWDGRRDIYRVRANRSSINEISEVKYDKKQHLDDKAGGKVGEYLAGCTLSNAEHCLEKPDPAAAIVKTQKQKKKEERRLQRRKLRLQKRLERRRKRKEMRKVKSKLMQSHIRRPGGGRWKKKWHGRSRPHSKGLLRRDPKSILFEWSRRRQSPFEALLKPEVKDKKKESPRIQEDVEEEELSADLTSLLASARERLLLRQKHLQRGGVDRRKPLPLLDSPAENQRDEEEQGEEDQNLPNWKKKRRRNRGRRRGKGS